MTRIGQSAFSECYALKSLSIGNNVSTIESLAFKYCAQLESINFPSSVTNVGALAVAGCYNLTSIKCYATIPPKIIEYITPDHHGGSYTYVELGENCSNITLYVPAGSVEAYKKADQWKDFGSILPL